MLLKHQALSLLESIRHLEDSKTAPDNVADQLRSLFKATVALFGKDAAALMTKPPETYRPSILTVRASTESLYSYIDFHLGDPVARELIGDEVQMARWSLKQGFALCAVLLCRVAKEQTMRRLCERHGIEHPPTAQPSTLAQSLRKENGGPLEKYQWKELDSKLTSRVRSFTIESSQMRARCRSLLNGLTDS